MSDSIEISLPEWLKTMVAEQRAAVFQTAAEKMSLAISLARENVERKTGGPFGAAVFDENTDKLLSVGVNSVVVENTSIAHAETVAITLAQKSLRTYDLSSDAQRKVSLYTTGQPCIMCFGVIWWSGIAKLVCAARTEDIEAIVGFKEGPLPTDWQQTLEHRDGLPDIEVKQDVLRPEACAILESYAASGLPVYNAGGK